MSQSERKSWTRWVLVYLFELNVVSLCEALFVRSPIPQRLKSASVTSQRAAPEAKKNKKQKWNEKNNTLNVLVVFLKKGQTHKFVATEEICREHEVTADSYLGFRAVELVFCAHFF